MMKVWPAILMVTFGMGNGYGRGNVAICTKTCNANTYHSHASLKRTFIYIIFSLWLFCFSQSK